VTARPRVALTIAGCDPSGGAGVQCDLRVFTALGVAGISAVTALTVQNSQGVREVQPVAGDLLTRQIEALLEDGPADAVKIGMLAGEEQVRAVAEALRRVRPPNVVLDPVLASTGGFPLLDGAGRDALMSQLLPLCDLVTPNVSELETLASVRGGTAPDRLSGARRLLERGVGAVLAKGGHLNGPPEDLLVSSSGIGPAACEAIIFAGERIDTQHTHGTGCFLSSAIAGYLALGVDLHGSIRAAKQLLTRALRTPVVPGEARGYPDAFAAAGSSAAVGTGRASHAERLRILPRGLYVIVDPEVRPDRSVEVMAREALAGGASVIQLRAKRLSTPEMVEAAKRLSTITSEAGALIIINDRVDVALAAGADGVHLGPEDIHPSDARRLLGVDALIGVSAGTVEEAVALAPFASYLGVGAIFGSATKSDAGAPVGLGRIAAVRQAAPDLPIVAIGGITADNVAEVARAGANSAAVISAVLHAPNIRLATERLTAAFRVAHEDSIRRCRR
jgi:hydroxymethylpyrimidine kinase/phosphomethylpyrimidine kinase/thiamine-phosphate diphosphorylase